MPSTSKTNPRAAAKRTGPPAASPPSPFSPTKPNLAATMRTEANRPVGPGPGHRGDRRDTNKAYTGNRRTHANHTNPRGSHGESGKGK